MCLANTPFKTSLNSLTTSDTNTNFVTKTPCASLCTTHSYIAFSWFTNHITCLVSDICIGNWFTMLIFEKTSFESIWFCTCRRSFGWVQVYTVHSISLVHRCYATETLPHADNNRNHSPHWHSYDMSGLWRRRK